MISVSCSFSFMNRWIGSRIVRLSGTAMIAQKRFDRILFRTSIVPAVTARACLGMIISPREPRQTYLHNAAFLAALLFLDLKPLLLKSVAFETGGWNSDSCRIPRPLSFNALQRKFRSLDIAPPVKCSASYHGRTAIISKGE
jgi:hypothetical protein